MALVELSEELVWVVVDTRVGTRNSRAPSGEDRSNNGVSTSIKSDVETNFFSQPVSFKKYTEDTFIISQLRAHYMSNLASFTQVLGESISPEIQVAES